MRLRCNHWWIALILCQAIANSGCRIIPHVVEGDDFERGTAVIAVNLRGQLEPCGCSRHMRGGLSRIAALVERERLLPQEVYLLLGGETWPLSNHPDVSNAGLNNELSMRTETLAQLFSRIGVTSLVGETSSLSTATGDPATSVPATLVESEGTLVVPFAGSGIAQVRAATPRRAAELAVSARGAGAPLVIAWIDASFAEVSRARADLGDVDLAIPTRTEPGESELSGNRVLSGPPVIAQPQDRGRSLLLVELRAGDAPRFSFAGETSSPDGDRAQLESRIELLKQQIDDPQTSEAMRSLREAKLADLRQRLDAADTVVRPLEPNSFRVRFVAVEDSIEPHSSVVDMLTEHFRNLGAANLEWARTHSVPCPDPPLGATGYAGNTACASCHATAVAAYGQTKHAASYRALAEKGRQHHLECVTCHVGGWNQPGGQCQLHLLDDSSAVGCESCHGAAALHASNPRRQKLRASDALKRCLSCHDPENSPHFDLARYLPLILGPGHGRAD